MTTTATRVLEAIRRQDPDGWESRQPADEDYRQFHHWVVNVYGDQAYRDYMNWGKA